MKRDLRCISIKAKLATASEYFRLMEAQLQDARSLETFLLSSKYDSGDEDIQGECSAMKQDLQNEFNEDYGPFFRQSFLIAFHSLVERSLEKVCDEIRKARGLEFKATDFRGGTLEQAKVFLTKVAKIPFQKLKNWQDLTDLTTIRNCLVHAEGKISQMKSAGDRDRLWVLVEKQKGLRVDARHAAIAASTSDKHPNEARLIIEALYCQQALVTVVGFFDCLFAEMSWS